MWLMWSSYYLSLLVFNRSIKEGFAIYLSMYGLKTRETLCIVHAQQTAVTETPR